MSESEISEKMKRTNMDVMERRFKSLETLQNNETEHGAESASVEVSNVLEHPPALQKSMELRQQYSHSFTNKLRERTRLSQTDSSAVRHRVSQTDSTTVRHHRLPSLAEHSSSDGNECEQGEKTDVNRALLGLRGILEEQKRRHAIKRKRLVEIREANAVAEKGLVVPEAVRRSVCSRSDDVSTITDPTFFECRDAPDYLSVGWKDETVLENDDETVDLEGVKGPKIDASLFKEDGASTTATSDLSDSSTRGLSEEQSRQSQALEAMKARVEALEEEKIERDESIASFLANYADKSVQLRRMEADTDHKRAECSEIQSLVGEKRQESDTLRGRLTSLENRTTAAKIWRRLISLSVLVLCACIAIDHIVLPADFSKKTHTAWNGICAPVKPGTKVSEGMGPLEAPWWAPSGYLKVPMYHLSGCSSRPRTRLEVIRGMLYVTSNNGFESLIKKPSKSVHAEAGTIHILDRYGAHVQVDAPWALH